MFCGSASRFEVSPRDLDILVFGKGITKKDRKELFALKIEIEDKISKDIKEKIPEYEPVKEAIIDLDINNYKKRKFIEKNDPMSLLKI